MTTARRLLVQVTLPSVVVGLVLLVASLLGVWSINRLQQNRARLVTRNVRSLQVAQQMEIYLRQVRSHSILYLIDPTAERRAVYEEDCRLFEVVLARAQRLADLPGEQRLLREVQEGYQRYRRELERARGQGASWKSASDLLRWIDTHPVRQLLKPCEELLGINSQAMETTARESEEVSARGRTLFLLMGLLGPVGGLISGFGAAWGFSRSISRMRIRLQTASAHLDQELGSVRVTGEGASDLVDRQLDHVVARVRDAVTLVQQQQRELIRTEQLAAIGQLAASIAHEVRNPLTGVKLLVGATLKRPGGGLSTEDLQFIHDEIERLERKVQALLEYARPSEPVRQPCDLREVVRQALHLVDTRVGQLGVRCEIDLPAGPVQAEVDRDQFTSVLVNLFLNALDALPRGGVLSVSVRQDPDGGIRLIVVDSGPGIDPNMAGRLFTPFASTKKTGTGLGLSISQRIVMGHAGTLTGGNRPEGGACFTVTLPGQTREAADGETADRG